MSPECSLEVSIWRKKQMRVREHLPCFRASREITQQGGGACRQGVEKASPWDTGLRKSHGGFW